MSKRWFLASLIGSGADTVQVRDPYRVALDGKLSDGGYHALIPTDANGQPSTGWALVLVDTTSFAALDADAALAGLPSEARDTPLTPARRGVLNAAVTKLGLANIPTAASTVGEAIQALGRRLDPTFDERVFGGE